MIDKNKIDVLSQISKQMKKANALQAKLAAKSPVANDDLQMQKNYENERKFWNEGGAVMSDIREELVSWKGGKVRTRIYYPTNADTFNALFFIHGGGWVVGSIDTHDKIMRNLAAFSGFAVVGIDYSLSPKAKFPQQILECEAAIEHYIKNAKRFKISDKFVAYGGDSAGANLAMATLLHQRDNKKAYKFVKAMLLYYGVYGLKDSVSRTLYGNDVDYLRQQDIKYYYDMYLQNKDDENSPFVNIFNSDLSEQIPPCFIASSEFDPLLDDSVVLYKILAQNDKSHRYKMYKKTMHAFLHYSRVMSVAKTALKDGAKFLNEALKQKQSNQERG